MIVGKGIYFGIGNIFLWVWLMSMRLIPILIDGVGVVADVISADIVDFFVVLVYVIAADMVVVDAVRAVTLLSMSC